MNFLKNFVLSFFAVLVVGVSSLAAEGMSQDDFRKAMDRYVGIWKGEYRIYSQEDELMNQFKLNRNYWWEGDLLIGRVSYDFGSVQQTYFHRLILSNGIPFSFVTAEANSDQIKSALKGDILKGTVVWTRVLPKGSLPVRISERIVDSDDGKYIEFWGDQEAKDSKGRSMLVRIEGFASYVPESRDLVVKTEEIDEPAQLELDAGGVLEDQPISVPVPVEANEILPQPVLDKEEPLVPQPIQDVNEEPVEMVTDNDPDPVSEPTPNADIEEMIQSLNVVGINENLETPCIVVDYFMLYYVGERLDYKKKVTFVDLDDSYLYFEDKKGFRYRLFRADKR